MSEKLPELTAQIVAAYTANNLIPVHELPSLIQGVYSALNKAGDTALDGEAEEASAPAVPIKKSVRPNAITCLECGKSQQMLKRHLFIAHDLTPEQYRAKWSLPPNYPLVAPNYAETRSRLAKASGLGQRNGQKGGNARAGARKAKK